MIDFITTIIQPIPSHTHNKGNLTNLKIAALATAAFFTITLLQLSYFTVAVGGLATASLLGKVIVYGVGITTYVAYAAATILSGTFTFFFYKVVKTDKICEEKINQVNNDFGQLLKDAEVYFGIEKEEVRQILLENNPKLVELLQKASEEERKNYDNIVLLTVKLRGEAISQIV